MSEERQEQDQQDHLLLIGYIVGAFGIRGQLKLKAVTDHPDHLEHVMPTIYITFPSRQTQRMGLPATNPYQLLDVLQHKPGLLVLTLKGINDRTQAETFRHAEVYIHQNQAAPLDEGEYFIHQLINLCVETIEGLHIGHVRDVLQTGANDVLIVARPSQPDALIPMVHTCVQQLDIASGRIIIHPLEGLLE